MKLSFYTPIAYDYKYAFNSIKSYYNIADEILLGLDKERISWSGIKFDFDESFIKKIKEFDIDNKILIIEKDFHSQKTPIDNDTKERNVISNLCTGDLIVGIDSDEVLLNANEFKKWTKNYNSQLDVSCNILTVYKSFGEQLLITMPAETTIIGTNLKYNYKQARNTLNSAILSPLRLLHYSWGRTEKELKFKLNNFGHSNQFNISKYFSMWQDTNLKNYKTKINFHPFGPKQSNWQFLELINLKDIK